MRFVRWQHHQLVLLVVLAIALILRIVGIKYGLPFLYVTDEYHEVMRAMQLGAGSFNIDRTGKGGLYYLLFLEFGLYYVYLKSVGVVSSAADFAALFARDPSAFYLMARVTVLVFAVANVWLLYALTKRIFNQRAAVVAALIFAVNVLHVDLSRTVRIDVVMTCLVTLTLLLAVDVAERSARKDYVLAAIAAALATTTKITAVLLLVPLLIAHGYAVRDRGGRIKAYIVDGRLWLAAATFLVLWFGTDPGLVFSLPDYFWLFAPSPGHVEGVATLAAEIRSVDRPNLFAFYAAALLESMGLPLFLVSAGAVAYALWRRTIGDVILLSYAVVTYLAIASTTSPDAYFPRYVLPLVPILAAFCGRLLSDLAEMVPLLRSRLALGVIVVALVLVPSYQSIQHGRVLMRTDTRTLAKQWIDTHVPQGAKVFVEGAKIAPVRSTVPLEDSADSMRERIAYWSEVEPRQATFLRHRLRVHDGKGFRLVLIPLGEEGRLEEYIDEGVQFFVVLPERMLKGRSATNRSAELLDSLRNSPEVALVAVFEQQSDFRPGPTVHVYRVVASGEGADQFSRS